MKVYTADKDADLVVHVYLWVRNVSWRATKIAIWLGTTKWGLGYVDLVPVEGDRIIGAETRRYYGPVWIKLKEAQK